MSSIWNNRISISFFGESDTPSVGVTIDNLPSGEYIDPEEIMKFMSRRAVKSTNFGQAGRVSSPRIMSGIVNDRTTGGALCAFLENTDAHAPVEQTEPFAKNIRIGHADYTGAVRYRGFSDFGDVSGFPERLTAPLCFAGAVCAQILERRGIYVGGHIASIHNTSDNPYDLVRIDRDGILGIRLKDFPVINDRKGWKMIEDISNAAEFGESLGGVVECAAVNVPAGVGSPIFNGLENNIAQLIFGIPSVKGLEFGAGFAAAKMIGSQNCDDFFIDSHGHLVTKTNNHGGVLGGISSGMPITLKVAFKPLTISAENAPAPCIVPQAVPCVEAAVNIALLSNMLDYPNFC